MRTPSIRFVFITTASLITAILLFVLPAPRVTSAVSSGVDVHVDTTTDEYNGPDCSLRDAIQTINMGSDHGGCTRVNNLTAYDKVLLPSGTYTLTIVGPNEEFNVTGDLDIRNSVIISATGVTSPTVTANSGWRDRIFDVVTGTVTIKGLVIRGGAVITSSLSGGGGVLVEPDASLTMSHSQVTNNWSDWSGGGIENDGILTLNSVTVDLNFDDVGGGGIENRGTATLSNVTLDHNSATYNSGGIENWGTATLSNVTLDGNTAQNTAGIANLGTATLSNVTLYGNKANSNGGAGGIYNSGTLTATAVTLDGNSTFGAGGGILNSGTLTLSSSTASGNSASNGGGIFNSVYGTMTLINSTFSGNVASNGGGIENGGIGILANDTISGNGGVPGGGLYQYAMTTTHLITLENTIISNALGANCYVEPISIAQIASSGYNLSNDDTCESYFNQSGDLNNTDPKLGPLQNNGGPTETNALLLGSPAIDAIPFGTNGCGTTITTDQRGVTRPNHTNCDIGAFEFEFQANNNVLLFLPFIKK